MCSIKDYRLKIFFLLGSLLLILSCEFNNHPLPQPINDKPSGSFIKGSQDIPLITGLTQIDEEDVEFDTILGGFDSSSYISNTSFDKITEFYLDILPKLGWKLQKQSNDQISFKRENQGLIIKFYQENNQNITNFSITTHQ